MYDYIDAHVDEHLAAIQSWLRQPSISAQNVGISDMAEVVRQDPEDWDSPPLAAELIDHELGKVLMARGATNQKGPERALLNALESIIAVHGKLPLNIMITAEGEEELGSPHYPQIIGAYENRLKTADAMLFPYNSQTPDGRARIFLGVKGLIYFEMIANAGEWGGPAIAEIHGSYKAIVGSPVWQLVRVLSTLVSPDGNTILVPGYYDDRGTLVQIRWVVRLCA